MLSVPKCVDPPSLSKKRQRKGGYGGKKGRSGTVHVARGIHAIKYRRRARGALGQGVSEEETGERRPRALSRKQGTALV